MYKVISKSTTLSGIKIQLESWKSGLKIAAYPTAMANIGFINSGETFRLEISRFNNDTEAKEAYNNLITGRLGITDLKKHFWNPEKDSIRLGIV